MIYVQNDIPVHDDIPVHNSTAEEGEAQKSWTWKLENLEPMIMVVIIRAQVGKSVFASGSLFFEAEFS